MSRRVAGGILQLFAQVNAAAPDRDKGSDGTFPSEEHHLLNPGSDHEPHVVPGVGDEICTAGDFTHDPPRFNADVFAEDLRVSRDPRIKYVIRRDRMFSSYPTSKYPAWTWRPYSGTYHGDHAHVSTLDLPISDTRTPWRINMATDPQLVTTNWRLLEGVIQLKESVNDHVNPEPQRNELAFALKRIEEKLDLLLAQAPADPSTPAATGKFSGTLTWVQSTDGSA